MHNYRDVEDGVMIAVADRFGIEPLMPSEVRAADARILLDERAALMTPPPADWGWITSSPWVSRSRPCCPSRPAGTTPIACTS